MPKKENFPLERSAQTKCLLLKNNSFAVGIFAGLSTLLLFCYSASLSLLSQLASANPPTSLSRSGHLYFCLSPTTTQDGESTYSTKNPLNQNKYKDEKILLKFAESGQAPGWPTPELFPPCLHFVSVGVQPTWVCLVSYLLGPYRLQIQLSLSVQPKRGEALQKFLLVYCFSFWCSAWQEKALEQFF